MTNNLNRPTVSVGMSDKEQAITDSDGALDAAITGELELTFSGAVASITLSAAQFRGAYFFDVKGTTSAPTPKIKTANVARGMFAVKNGLSQALDVEDYGALLANISVPSGATYVFVAHAEGNDVIVRGGEPVFTLNFEASARVATTANITLSGEQTIDGISAVTGDRVLVKDQTSAVDNGIYTVAAGAWSRASATWQQGTAFVVDEGTANGGKVFVITTPPPITVGVTSINFVSLMVNTIANFTALGDTFSSYTGKGGYRLQVKETEDGIEAVAAAAIDLSTYRNSVRAASTGNLTLNDEQTIDGVAVIAGDRVLVKDQTDETENGIYDVVNDDAWIRSADMDTDVEVVCGLLVAVEEGTTNGGLVFMQRTANPISLGVSDVTFAQVGGSSGAGGSVAWKDPVRVATTANITISTALNSGDTIDGITLADDDRVLVKNQSTGSQNGIYVVSATPTRSTDCDEDSEVLPGFAVMVQEGTDNADLAFKLTTDGPITVGSTALTFTKFNPTLTTELLDMPSSLTGQAGKALRVNSGATAYEHYTPAAAEITLNTQTASYALVLTDAGKYVRMNVASPNNLTVPTNASVAFAIGTQIPVRQVGAGQTTIVASGGVTINTPETLNLRKQGSSGMLVKVATDEWDLTGDLEPL